MTSDIRRNEHHLLPQIKFPQQLLSHLSGALHITKHLILRGDGGEGRGKLVQICLYSAC